MKALITGITGRDGYFLSQFLLERRYDVYGIVRRNSNRKIGNLELLPERIKKNIHIFEGDMTDTNFINNTVERLKLNDFVLGTGEAHTVREFVEEAFKVAGIKIHREGSGLDEKGVSDDGRILVKVNKEFFRPLDTNPFIADYSKAKRLLNWYLKTSFGNLVKIMVKYDIEHYNKA